MTGPVLTKALTRLRSDVDAAFTERSHESDGWIGDAAHQASTSGHNPDDTPGSRAEYTDADTKAEVRALDLDSDLNKPGWTMQDLVDQILANPNNRKRLAYVIYDRIIWSANTDWEPRTYTGSSPHVEHSHFSGDPDYDEDDSSWEIGDGGMEQTDLLKYPTTNNPNRKVGQVLTDLSELRDALLAEEGTSTSHAPTPTSHLGAALVRVEKLEGWAADATVRLDAITAALARIEAAIAALPPGSGNTIPLVVNLTGTASPQV